MIVDKSKYWVEWCEHCKRYVIAHKCPYNLATCSPGYLCPDCEGGHYLELNYSLEDLIKMLGTR